MSKQNREYVGKRVPRTDVEQQLNGICRYGDDYFLPGMLIARPKYSEYAHAKILRIDVSRAEAMPGVAAVITHKDVPNNRYGTGPVPDQPVLADTKVCFKGDCIAVVAAENNRIAQAAVDAITVEYEPLPTMMTMEEALAENALPIHPEVGPDNIAKSVSMHLGDTAKALAQADLIVENTYWSQKVEHAPIEPRVALAEPIGDGGVHVITSCSRVFNFVLPLSKILQMPMSRLRVSLPEAIGGSFGGKNDLLIEPWVALLAMKTRRPVKLTLTREEDMRSSTIRHAYRITHKTGVMQDGTIVADQVTMDSDTGAYYAIGIGQLMKATTHCCGCYRVNNMDVAANLVFTNTLSGSAMRGMGVPQSTFAWESHLDYIAEKLGMDPVELRRKNLFDTEGRLINGQVVDSRAARLCFEKALEIYHDTETLPPVEGKRRGFGIANMIYPQDASSTSSATAVVVKIDGDGTAVIYNGLSDVGQGSKTALSQIAAELLGIPLDKISFVNGDTRMTPYDEGTGASRTIFICGHCLEEACKKVQRQLFEAAGILLGVYDYRKYEIKGGEIYLKTFPERHVSVAEASFAAERLYGHPIVATANFSTYSTKPTQEDGHALLYERHTFGTQIAEIDVEEATGEITLRKIIAVHSCGTTINPMLVEGQIYGGVQMGIGHAMMEQMQELKDGTVVSNALSEYHIPTACDMPEIFRSGIVECEVEDGPFGAGGLSEGAPSPTAAAINNALADATGIHHTVLPLTPERILLAMNKSKG